MYVLDLRDVEGHLVEEKNKFYPNRVIFNDCELETICEEIWLSWRVFLAKFRNEKTEVLLKYLKEHLKTDLNLESEIRIRLRYLEKLLELNPGSILTIRHIFRERQIKDLFHLDDWIMHEQPVTKPKYQICLGIPKDSWKNYLTN